jgi:hypothetical protein
VFAIQEEISRKIVNALQVRSTTRCSLSIRFSSRSTATPIMRR